MQTLASNKLNEVQVNMIKSFAYLHDEKQIRELDSLINFYLEKKLDIAIEQVEAERGYTADIYDQWLSHFNK